MHTTYLKKKTLVPTVCFQLPFEQHFIQSNLAETTDRPIFNSSFHRMKKGEEIGNFHSFVSKSQQKKGGKKNRKKGKITKLWNRGKGNWLIALFVLLLTFGFTRREQKGGSKHEKAAVGGSTANGSRCSSVLDQLRPMGLSMLRLIGPRVPFRFTDVRRHHFRLLCLGDDNQDGRDGHIRQGDVSGRLLEQIGLFYSGGWVSAG